MAAERLLIVVDDDENREILDYIKAIVLCTWNPNVRPLKSSIELDSNYICF